MKSNGKYNIVCVAHPDDETIFFGGLLSKKRDDLPWKVICVTSDGDEDRHRQFNEACAAFSIADSEWWAYPDKYELRLPIAELAQRLAALESPNFVYTHGIIGEYGHPHHQDVSYAVHLAFAGHPNLFASSYNSFPEFEVRLSESEFREKARILTKVYGSETSRFLNVLPATFVEGFLRLEMAEVEAVYGFLARREPLKVEALNAYKWLQDYLPRLRDLPRPF